MAIDPLQPVFQVFSLLIHQFWWLIPVLLLFLAIKTPAFKGQLGELAIKIVAYASFNGSIYQIINDITLPTEDGGSTQIDHIIVSPYGVFVIETKTMKGWIYGKANDEFWTQKIYKHSQNFQNPLRQNFKHTETLRRALSLDKEKIFSVVVFAGDSQFKTQMPTNVVRIGEYVGFIKSKTDEILSRSEIHQILVDIDRIRLA